MLFVLPESAKKTPFLEVDEYWLDHTAHFSLVTRTDVPGSMKSMMARSATFLQSVVSALNPVKSSSPRPDQREGVVGSPRSAVDRDREKGYFFRSIAAGSGEVSARALAEILMGSMRKKQMI
jgi:hypothetical protein